MTLVDELVGLADDLGQSDDVPDLMHKYLQWARTRLSGSAFGIYVFRPRSAAVDVFETSGVSDLFLARYEEVGRSMDPLLAGVISHGVTTDNLAIMSPHEWQSSPIYAEVYGLHRFGRALQAPILACGHVMGTLNYGDRSPDTFDGAAVERIELLGRAVGLALTIVQSRGQADREERALRLALELVDQPVIVTDIGRGARYLNSAAEQICQRISDPGDLAWFEDLVADGQTDGSVQRAAARLTDLDGAPVAVEVRTVMPDDAPTLRLSLLTCDDGEASAVPAAMAAMLTPREREVAALVAAGMQDPQIAARLYLSPYTVKAYVKSTYRKLGVRSRVELTRMMLAKSNGGPNDVGPANRADDRGGP